MHMRLRARACVCVCARVRARKTYVHELHTGGKNYNFTSLYPPSPSQGLALQTCVWQGEMTAMRRSPCMRMSELSHVHVYERQRQRDFESFNFEDDGFRSWPNLPTDPR